MSLKKNALWNLVGSVAPMLIGLVTIPYLVKNLGIELFGVLTLVWALIGYFSLFDFGLGRALTQSIAEERAAGTDEKIELIARVGLITIGLAGAIGFILILLSSKSLGYHYLNVSQGLEYSTYKSLLIAAFGIPLTTFTVGLKGVLEAFEEFKIVNQLRTALGVANFLLPALIVYFIGPSIEWIVLSIVFSRFIICLLHMMFTMRIVRVIGSISLNDVKSARKLFNFGAWMTLSNIISPLMVVSDRFLISYYLGAASVALYTVPAEFLTRLLVVPAAYTAALFPRLARLGSSEFSEYKATYFRSLKFITPLMILIFILVAAFAHQGLSLWISSEFAEKTSKIAVILALGVMFNGIAQVPHCAIQACGGAKITALIHIVEFLVYIPLLFLFMHYYGVVGAAIAWTIRAFIDMVALFVFAKKITLVRIE